MFTELDLQNPALMCGGPSSEISLRKALGVPEIQDIPDDLEPWTGEVVGAGKGRISGHSSNNVSVIQVCDIGEVVSGGHFVLACWDM